MTVLDIKNITQIQSNENYYKIHNPIFRQCFLCFGVGIIVLACGMAEGYSTILLSQLEDSNAWAIDNEISSWIAAITPLASSVGSILGGISMERIGRKYSCILTSLTSTLGWLMIYWATSIPLLLTGRFLTGLCLGLIGPCSAVYIAEISQPKLRGILLSTSPLALCFGIFLSHAIGCQLIWTNTALISAILSTAGLMLIASKESPIYLMKLGNVEEATESFYWYRGHSKISDLELKELVLKQKQETKSGFNLKRNLIQVTQPEFYIPMLVMSVFFFTNQWSGYNAVIFYSMLIIRDLAGDNVNKFFTMLIMDSLRLIMAILACFASRKFSRRAMILTTGFGMTGCLLSVSICAFFSKYYPDLQDTYSYLPLIGLICYTNLASVGFQPLTWVVLGEIFPQSTRGLGCGMSAFFNNVWLFTVVKSVHFLILSIGIDGTFFIYGLTALVGTTVLLAVLPETKNRTLQEIEDRLKESKGIQFGNEKNLNGIDVN